IIFYSFSGNTRDIAFLIKDKLEGNGHSVDVVRLTPFNEVKSCFSQAKQAFLKEEVELINNEYNLAGYDFVIFGSPVWAVAIVPAMRSYLRMAEGLENKKAAVFFTYGGIGAGQAIKEFRSLLDKKGARIVFVQSLLAARIRTDQYLERKLEVLFKLNLPLV
ncbi:MAG: flavodoxin domain-containing protein, partial [Candidatus Omnitrophota bacterium]